MQVFNRANIDKTDKLKDLIDGMIKIIPKKMIPKFGIPDFHITTTLLHSYAVMYEKYEGVKSLIHQENFFTYLRNGVWAFTAFQWRRRGDIYLAVEKRLDDWEEDAHPIEFTIFHEIGHHWLFGNNEWIDVCGAESERLSDEYAMSCFLRYVLKNNLENGFCGKFDEEWKRIISDAKIRNLNGTNLLKTGKELLEEAKKRGVII